MKILSGFLVIVGVIQMGFANDDFHFEMIEKVCRKFREIPQAFPNEKLMKKLCDMLHPIDSNDSLLPPELRGLKELSIKIGDGEPVRIPIPKELAKSDLNSNDEDSLKGKSRQTRENVPGHFSNSLRLSPDKQENNKKDSENGFEHQEESQLRHHWP